MSSAHNLCSGLAGFAHGIETRNLAPLRKRTLRMQPGLPCVPALRRYADALPLLAHGS